MPIRGDRLRWPPRPGKRSNAVRSGSEARGNGERAGSDNSAADGGARDAPEHARREAAPDGARDAGTRDTGTRDAGTRDTGTRQTRSTDEHAPAPRQPNERDTSADSQASAPRDVMRQAHDDVTGGQMDTDCRNSAVEVVERNESKPRRTP